MLNQLVLIGRIASDLEKSDAEKNTIIELAVSRSFKNENGEYETDIIPCIISGNVASNLCEYSKKGDIIGVKGRLQNIDNIINVIADKITLLSSRKEDRGE